MRFPPSKTSFHNDDSLGRQTDLPVMVCHCGCPVGRVLTEERDNRCAFKFGTPLLHILQEVQSGNRTSTCNCASGPVLAAEINHDDVFLVPRRCDKNSRSPSKNCLVPPKQCLQKVRLQKGVYCGMFTTDHKLFKVLSHPILRPFPNLFQIKLAFLEKYLHFLQMCGFMMR